jgi:hypothetical protein
MGGISMSKLGGWWLVSHEAQSEEEVVWSRSANRMQGSRAVGGKLLLTDRRILFCPHLIDGLLGGKRWATETRSVAEVGIEPKGSGKASKLGGGMRDRLRIRSADGTEELFVVKRLEEEVVPRLTEAVPGGVDPPATPG